MGEIEIDKNNRTIKISSHIITYGNEVTEELAERMRKEIETMWNEPKGFVYLGRNAYQVIFSITAEIKKEISELEILQNVTGNKVISSRQHYIRFTLPETFRRLIDQGIQFDYSMGYGSINGFRASVASPFYWFDLEKEKQTELLLFPFCYMDANSFYEQKYTAQQALEEMRQYYKTVKSVNGTFIMIWHNHFLGTDPLYAGWKEIYEQFIGETSR